VKTDQVFVSHTSDMALFPTDRSFVQAALDGIGRAGMASVDMRYFAARNGKPSDYCQQRVRGCEIYVALIGFRYGSIVPGLAVSYTELEYEAASAAGLPRLIFLLKEEPTGQPLRATEADRGPAEAFRQRLREAGLIVRTFASAAGLELEVFHALTDLAFSGLHSPGPAPVPRAVRYSLPPDTAAFTGRDTELDRITAGVTDAAGSGGVVTIDGMPGVGKTALAVHVAHRLRERFPDRQWFVDLLAHTPGQDPVVAQTALAGLLAAAGMDTRTLPGELGGLAGLWRDRLAGQRSLLILDNAASSAQVAPLLPGGDGCLVLVTSRRHLGDLPGAVVPVLLDALAPSQAEEMFLRLAPCAAGAGEAVHELTRLAGYLPLAISLLARVYARHPSWTLADLIRETQASLLTLAAEKHSVAAAFDVSYRYLTPGQQQFFRCLGLHPGTTIDAYAAAALTGVSLQEAGEHLDAMHGEGLLTEAGCRRYGMHDLIRRYARDRAAADPAAGRDRALDRLLDYYQHVAAITETLMGRPARNKVALAHAPAAVPDLPDGPRALAWARTERASLLACLDHATRARQHTRIVALTASVTALLRQDGPWADAITRHCAAIGAARHLGDLRGQASALRELGVVQGLTGAYPGAAEALEEALSIFRDLGDQPGEADALNELGTILRLVGDYPRAAEALEEALRIFRKLGDRPGEAAAVRELGAVRYMTFDYPGAIEALVESLVTYRDLGDRTGQARALSHLGAVRRQTVDYPGATRALEEALGISRDLGDRTGQARALSYLGGVRRLTGDYPGATRALEEALGISRDLGNRLSQANILNYLGEIRQLVGDYPGAIEALVESLATYRDLGDRLGQANALNDLGTVRRLTGDYPGAAAAHQEALGTYRDLGDKGGQAEVLNETGALYRVSGDLGRAGACHRQALALAREIDSPRDEAYAWAGLGRCALAGGTSSAAASLRQAQEIFQRIGAIEATSMAAELSALARAGLPQVSRGFLRQYD
jgi:tetratricopeptide (TPR) repeat protein